jgi:predicted DNA-binding antitoxin AbrB/MazE fold protein
MAITVDAIYENGVLRLEKPLPFREHERVRVSVQPTQSIARESAGMLRWRGDWETLHRLAENDEFGILESRGNNLTCLASNDVDFDRVPGITRYTPA